jgi:putative addiction module component (TIGR02574 family)
MPATMKELGVDRLSAEERLALMHEIWDSLANEPGRTFLTEAQRRELDKRLAENETDPDNVIPWERVKAEALARFQS